MSLLLPLLWADAHNLAPHAVASPSLQSGAQEKVFVSRVDHDSRSVVAGSLFCCVRGQDHDGHDYAAAAVKSGASALLVERRLPLPVPQLVMEDVRRAMPWFAAAVLGNPSRHLRVVGVTGTNGKTTTVQLLCSIAASAGLNATPVGTLTGVRTTPESTDLQRRLAQEVAEGTDLVAMEVSSHALDQGRADAVRFDAAIFTNLTPDHLDYHQSMDDYFAAKTRLFDGRAAAAVINADDPWGQRLLAAEPTATPFSLAATTVLEETAQHSLFVWRGRQVRLPLAGDFNIANALAAAEAAIALGMEADVIAAGLASVPQVPGRMEIAIAASPTTPLVLVDYSHTPDGIEKVLASSRRLVGADGRLTIVFGAGGDRDRSKRPLMGTAAAAADHLVVTSDNPRSEDPRSIIDQILTGVDRDLRAVSIEPDRRSAIALALAEAGPGDVVVIAGKGHEATQTIGDQVLPFLDLTVAQEIHRALYPGEYPAPESRPGGGA